MWSEGVGNLNGTTGGGMHSSSVQSSSTGDYYVEGYNKAVSDTTSERQFSVAYGHKHGSGSIGAVGSTGDRTTAAVFGQFHNLINAPTATHFSFKGNTRNSDDIYAITINRARMREKVDPGNWELHISGGAGEAGILASTLKLIDDSSTNTSPSAKQVGTEYNIVSGSISSGVASIKTAADSETTYGSYGYFYPDIGVFILNPSKLSGSIGHLKTVSASNTANNNHTKLWRAVTGSGYFAARREEKVSSNHYFIRAKNANFNYSTNPTWSSGSDGSLMIEAFKGNPKTFITSVALYGSAGDDILAIAKLSKPILKDATREALIKVKLDF
jgi:hypothetical protein